MQNGLFNLTPEMVAEARSAQDMQKAEKMFGNAGLFAPLARRGSMFQSQLNRGLGGDPQMKMAEDFKRIKSEASSRATPGTVAYHMAVRDALNAAGYPEVAAQAQSKIDELTSTKRDQIMDMEKANLDREKFELDKQKAAKTKSPSVGAAAERKAQAVGFNSFASAPLSVRQEIDRQLDQEKKEIAKLRRIQINNGDVNQLKHLGSALSLKKNVMGPMLENKEAMSALKTIYSEVAGGNPQALPSLRKAINSIYDSGNIGQHEAEIALGKLSLVGEIEGMIETLFSGNITDEKIMNVGKLIVAMEKDLEQSFNTRASEYDSAIKSSAELTEEMKKVLAVGGYKKDKKPKGVRKTSTGTSYTIVEE